MIRLPATAKFDAHWQLLLSNAANGRSTIETDNTMTCDAEKFLSCTASCVPSEGAAKTECPVQRNGQETIPRVDFFDLANWE